MRMIYVGKQRPGRVFLFLICCALILFSSCVSNERLRYVQKGDDFNVKESYFNTRPDRNIRPYDNLYIKILSIDGQSVVSLLDTDESYRGGNELNLIYYLVNDSGQINIPFIEDIEVGGMTLEEAKKKIETKLEGYLVNPSIIIKFVNNQVTILGEVNQPGTYPYYKEPINLFQALGLAGGIKEFGDKKEVILIREENNLITQNTIDLTDKKIVESYFYYIKPDDVIIVNHINAKFYGRGAVNITTVLSTVTTLVAVLYFFQARAETTTQ